MLEPIQASEWDRSKAAHLLKRAGFGGTQEEINSWAQLTPTQAVDKLVDWELIPDETKDPEWAVPGYGLPFKDRKETRSLPDEQRKALFQEYQRTQRQNTQNLRERWLDRMLTTPRPLQEKLTLFWHGHFATSAEKVKLAYFMWKQLDLFRRMGNGSYEKLLVEVGRDPAMLVWLDGAESNRNAPNENYARELMELFTLGEGHYTEDDIKESARAFTGWTVDRFGQTARYVPQRFDGSRKKFLGSAGTYKDEDIVHIILKQDQAARHITSKLWTFFAYENPEPELIENLAATFRSEKMEFKPLLKRLFLSKEFYSAKATQTQIKSPVQWWIGMQKSLEVTRTLPRLSTTILTQLGQNLLQPPSVKGWDGGRTWISTTTLMLRHNVAHMMIYGGTPEALGMGDVLKRFAEDAQAKKKTENEANPPDMMMEEKEDPSMQQRQKMAQKAMKRNFPGMMDPNKLAPSDQRQNRNELVARLTERLLQSPPSATTLKNLQKSLSDTDRVLNDEQIKALLYQIMIRPEFQLT
jgi:uncharacterized protein (DUF1800 family)